jgi:CheY-like chemotaxis protein
MTNILIVDDQISFRRQLRKLLTLAGMNVVAEAGDIPEAKEMVREFQPDLAVVDVMLPGTNGIDGTPQLKALCDSLRVILISAYQDFHNAAKEVGAERFVSKGELDLETVRAWAFGQEEKESKQEVRNET